MTDSTKRKLAVSTALVLAISVSMGNGHLAFAESFGTYNEHYNIGHHEGALMDGID